MAEGDFDNLKVRFKVMDLLVMAPNADCSLISPDICLPGYAIFFKEELMWTDSVLLPPLKFAANAIYNFFARASWYVLGSPVKLGPKCNSTFKPMNASLKRYQGTCVGLANSIYIITTYMCHICCDFPALKLT
eukprot:1155486-Pelagomonas_calceolata.AAC.1